MKFLFLLVSFTLIIAPSFGQRFGYIDSRAIIEKLPEYKEAQSELDNLAKNWQNEIEERRKEVEKLRKKYLAEEVIYDEYDKRKSLEEIREKEEEARDFQVSHFGYEGQLFLKKQELVVPIQEKIMKAIATACRKGRLEFVFDKAANIVIIYADPRHNYTKNVIDILVPKKVEEEGFRDRESQKEEIEPEPANRLGYIDTEFIIKRMPEYEDVENEIDRLRKRWHRQIAIKKNELDSLKQAFQEEEVMLTSEMKAEKLKEIQKEEEEFIKLQNDLLGTNGLIFTKRIELMKPLQEKIFEATEKVAEKKMVDFVFDKTEDIAMIYSNPVYDYSDFVLEEMELGDPEDTVR